MYAVSPGQCDREGKPQGWFFLRTVDSTVKIWTCLRGIQTRCWLLLGQAGHMNSSHGLCLLCRDRWTELAYQTVPSALHSASLLLLGAALSAAKTMSSSALQVPCWILPLPLCPHPRGPQGLFSIFRQYMDLITS